MKGRHDDDDQCDGGGDAAGGWADPAGSAAGGEGIRRDVGVSGREDEAGETPEVCLVRELREEFGIEATVDGYLMSSRAVYPELIVELHAYEVRYVGGAFELTDHDAIAWVAADEFGGYEVPEADRPVVSRLVTGDRIPEHVSQAPQSE